MEYSRPDDIQRDLDIDFREMHPNVDPSLTLAMIRNMKNSMFEIGRIQEMEMSSIAMSFVYFERLILKGSLKISNHSEYLRSSQ